MSALRLPVSPAGLDNGERADANSEGAAVAGTGRPRDERATQAITEAALRQLADVGYARMSMESVASEAKVARATIYRRYRDKADLVTAAIAGRPDTGAPLDFDHPLESLVRLLEEFDARFAESCLEVIGCLLAAREEPGAMALHRSRVVVPRHAAGRSLLERAVELGQLRADTDVDLMLQMLVGAVFTRRVHGIPPEPGWAARALDLACRGAST